MKASILARLARMDPPEIAWRMRAHGRIIIDRTRSAARRPAWRRERLADALASWPELDVLRSALASRRSNDAQGELTRHLASTPSRFVIAAENRPAIVAAIGNAFPESASDAVERADRIVGGEYDLLGYQGLRFSSDPAVVDWHYDPVHDRRPPRVFWSTVPYLDPASGDHKIIWELNRHQHWLALGRAFWLTGDHRYRNRFIAELKSWLDANPPLFGINWASMLELGLRSLSWIWALHFFSDPAIHDQSPWTVDLLAALDCQLKQIERNLSCYFSPNTHLIGEALALYVAGRSLPELAASGRWAALGRRVLVEEIDRQIAPDGGHCERSTHYQRYTLDFYTLALTIARITADPAAEVFAPAVARLASAARSLANDEGRMPLIGDDDGGALWPVLGRAREDIRDSLVVAGALVDRPDLPVGPVPEEAHWMLAHASLSPLLDRVGVVQRRRARSIALAETGYYISRSAGGHHLVIDGGPHGYRNGGHAHADALSLTLSVGGLPLLIDPGTGCYTTNPGLRDRMRSTTLHNTLLLDGRSQSEPRGPFHWRKTADASVLRWHATPALDYFVGVHDGYQPAAHRRHVLMLHDDLLVVADLVDGAGAHTAALHWHVDPRWTVVISGRSVDVTADGQHYRLVVPAGVVERFVADPATGLGWYAPVYGRLEPSTTIRVSAAASAPFWMVSVFGLDVRNQVRDVTFLPVETPGSRVSDTVGLRISRTACSDDLVFAEPAAGAPSARWRMGKLETDSYLFLGRTVHGQSTRSVVADLRGDTSLCAA